MSNLQVVEYKFVEEEEEAQDNEDVLKEVEEAQDNVVVIKEVEAQDNEEGVVSRKDHKKLKRKRKVEEEELGEEPEFVRAKAGSGGKILLRQGYSYVAESVRSHRQYYRCSKKREQLCKARLHTANGKITRVVGEHNHLPDPALKNVLTTLQHMKESAVNSSLSVTEIVENVIDGVDPMIASQLPSVNALKRSLQRIKQKAKSEDLEVDSAQHFIIPDLCKVTTTGEDFLLYDSEDSYSFRVLLFSTHQNLSFLGQSPDWLIDGSYPTVPHPLKCMLTVLALHRGKPLPLVYILLSEDTPEAFRIGIEKMLLIEGGGGMNPKLISVEFNPKYVHVLEEHFPEAHLQGRLYHLCQILFKRVQLEGLEALYLRDVNFSVHIRMLAALGFVPLGQIRDMFEMLSEDFPKEAIHILGYFEDAFIGRYRSRCGQDVALYPWSLWNYSHIKEDETFLFDNKVVEEWQETLQNLTNQKPHGFRMFLKGLLRRQEDIRDIVEQIMSGLASSKGRNKKSQELFILNTLRNYKNTEPMDFLRLIATNIGK